MHQNMLHQIKLHQIKLILAAKIKTFSYKINVICITAAYTKTSLQNFHTSNSVWENYKCNYSAIYIVEP